jgi:cyanate permease
LGIGLLTAGVLIAVIGSMTVPSLLAESEDVRPVVVAFISLAIGVPMALLGMKYMRPPAKKK